MTKLRLRLWRALLRLNPRQYHIAIDNFCNPRHVALLRRQDGAPSVFLDSWHDPADELPRTYCTRRGCPARKG